MRRTGVWLILLSVTLSLAVPLAYGGMAGLCALQALSAPVFILLLIMAMASWLCTAARLRLLARVLGAGIRTGTAVSTVVACEFAAVTTPLGSGSLPTHILLLSRQGLNAGRTIAIMAMDRVMDLVFFATALPCAIAAYVLKSGEHSDFVEWGVITGILLMTGLAILYTLLHHHRFLALNLGRLIRHIPWLKTKRRRLGRLFIQFQNSLRQLFGMGLAPLAGLYVLCMGHWLLRYSILPLLLWFTGHPVPWGYLFVVQGLVLFLGQLSMLPGGAGSVEVALGLLLSPYLNPPVTAATLLGWRFITFHWSLLAGAPVFLYLVGRRSAPAFANARAGINPFGNDA